MTAVQRLTAELDDLLDPGVEVEQLATGFTFTEGPIWHPAGGYLLFSDIPESRRRRWSPTEGATIAHEPTNKSNGMTLDAAGNLVICEHATSRVVLERPDGSQEILASHYRGRELNSPNDVIVAADGSIYFTDPTYGRREGAVGQLRDLQLAFRGVYRIAPGGAGSPELVVAEDEFGSPNGLCLSPDGATLYVDDTERGEVKAFAVAADGSLRSGRVFASGIGPHPTGSPDGMKCDERGNLWLTGPGGVWILDPDGRHLGVLQVPEKTANLNWGGPDWRELYLTASTSLYRVATRVAGSHASYMDVR
ncbi:MAG: SMP-30/gluconolactonase/LRE family protein [Candidatus Dormiibacterota bacterium]